MIRPLAHSLPPPSPVSKLFLFLNLPVCRRSSLLTGGGRGWARSQIMWPRESLALFKLFNTLWLKGSKTAFTKRGKTLQKWNKKKAGSPRRSLTQCSPSSSCAAYMSAVARNRSVAFTHTSGLHIPQQVKTVIEANMSTVAWNRSVAFTHTSGLYAHLSWLKLLLRQTWALSRGTGQWRSPTPRAYTHTSTG